MNGRNVGAIRGNLEVSREKNSRGEGKWMKGEITEKKMKEMDGEQIKKIIMSYIIQHQCTCFKSRFIIFFTHNFTFVSGILSCLIE